MICLTFVFPFLKKNDSFDTIFMCSCKFHILRYTVDGTVLKQKEIYLNRIKQKKTVNNYYYFNVDY